MTDIVFFPGMGADKSLSEYHEAIPGRHHWLDWVDPGPARSLNEYAQLMRPTIPVGEQAVFVGISFGGLVALELADVCRARMVILIGSLTHRGELARFFRTAGILLPFVPPFLFRPALVPAMITAPLFGLRDGDHIDLFLHMARRYSGSFIKQLTSYVLRKSKATHPACPVLRAHGDFDRIIARPRFAHLRVPGGHLISLTNQSAVNGFISKCIASI